MDVASLRQTLEEVGIADVRYFDSIGSTNDEAMHWAEAGAPDFALVIADQQTQGRGRLGRRWVTNPGSALAFSLIFRPRREEAGYLGQFSPLGGLGVAGALRAMDLPAQIKWPNDVLARRKKLCGILAEAVWSGSELRGLILGIGVNVAPDSVPPPEEVMFPATCVEWETGGKVDRLELIRDVLIHLRKWRAQIGKAEFLAEWQERLAFRDEMVEVHPPGVEAVYGRLVGVDAEGSLRLQLPNGEETRIAAGDVHLRPDSGKHSTLT